MAKAKKLTERQQQILGLLDEGKSATEIAGELGLTPASVYNTRRRLIDAGHLTARAKKRRAAALAGTQAAQQALAENDETEDESESEDEPENGSGELVEYEPVLVIQRRKNDVDEEIEHLTDLVVQATKRLHDLNGERERLWAALVALSPDESSEEGSENGDAPQAEGADETAAEADVASV
jgi:DNA-binding CsgD family transcriptional regulator